MFERFKKKKEIIEQPEIIDSTLNLSDGEIDELVTKAETIDEEEFQQHGKHYTEDGLWNKIKKYSKKAGSSGVYAVLLLYFVLQKDDVPKKDKAIIVGALGYFIFPFDLIPDVAAGVGYTDDIGALLVALLRVSIYIDNEVKSKAKSKLKDLFGDDIDTSEIDDKLI